MQLVPVLGWRVIRDSFVRRVVIGLLHVVVLHFGLVNRRFVVRSRCDVKLRRMIVLAVKAKHFF